MRNGDRWTITRVHRDGALSLVAASGHSRVKVPADYAAEHVALAYAVTIHKAQGVTVDTGVCLVDEHTTAEGLYVGMTRGRQRNLALALTDTYEPDRDHRPPQPASPGDVLRAALSREGGELSATETLRRALEQSESLAVLAPRLANLEAELARERPPDRSIDLARLANQRQAAHANLRPGLLTARGREDRRSLQQLDHRQAALEAEQGRYEIWMADHAEDFAYRDQLAAAIEQRRRALGEHAVRTQPDHLVRILGPLDHASTVDGWRNFATWIEAYREEWGVQPDQLGEPPVDGVQYRAWQDSVDQARRIRATAARLASIGLDRGIGRGIERGHGIEL